ncbi:MAG: hypothetical protein ACREBG_04860 [Pyrinomonadaceae bacterium]
MSTKNVECLGRLAGEKWWVSLMSDMLQLVVALRQTQVSGVGYRVPAKA